MSELSFIDTLRGPKILNMSIFDWTATFFVAVLINYFVYNKDNFSLVNTMKVFIVLIIIAVLSHYFFKVPTMFNYYLGLNSLQAVLDNRPTNSTN